MAIRNVGPDETFESWREKTNNIATDVGDIATLNTAPNAVQGTATDLTAAVKTKEDIGVAVAMAVALGG
jgi:hypothetical protein